MESFAQVVIRGRLGSNKEGQVLTKKDIAGGGKYWRFSVGVEKKRYIKETDITVVGTDWISCTCWDDRILEGGFVKGQVVQVTGKLTTYGEKVVGQELPKTRLAVMVERVQPVIDERDNWGPLHTDTALPSGSRVG